MNSNTSTPSRIRSYVRREGRLTRAQVRALETLWPRFGIVPEGVLDLDAIFHRQAERTLEIGFGNGDSLADMAVAEPEHDYLGIEVHRPGVGHLLLEIEKRGLENIRIINADAMQVLQHHIADHSFDRVLLLFADPWPKKRHHKRRLVQSDFVELLASKIRMNGVLHLATDWENYAGSMLAIMEASPSFLNTCGPGQFSPRPASRPLTKFERRGQRLGHQVWDLVYTKPG